MPPNLPRGMAFQIYQAWLQGPHALSRLFKKHSGGRLSTGLRTRASRSAPSRRSPSRSVVSRRRSRGCRPRSAIHYRNFRLQRRNEELEALAAKEKDAHNSSRPPSSGPPWAKRTRGLRRPSGRRPGGQAGHLGETLRLSEQPSRVVEHRPQECRGCHAPLDSAQVIGHRRQQVVEVVPARLRVTEHRLAVLRCRACGKATRGEFVGSARSGVRYGPGVKARVLYLQQYQRLP